MTGYGSRGTTQAILGVRAVLTDGSSLLDEEIALDLTPEERMTTPEMVQSILG